MLAQEIPLLTRLSNHLTETLESFVFGNERPTRLGMAATMALGQLLHLRGALARPAAAKFIIASLLSSVYEGVGFEKFRSKRLEFLKSKETFSSLEPDKENYYQNNMSLSGCSVHTSADRKISLWKIGNNYLGACGHVHSCYHSAAQCFETADETLQVH